MSREEVLQKIRAFYEKKKRTPESADFRRDYAGSGLPAWATLKKHYPNTPLDLIISEALGVETLDKTLENYLKTHSQPVIYATASDLKKYSWANTVRIARYLTSLSGKTAHGYAVKLYTGGTREHGYLFQFTRTGV